MSISPVRFVDSDSMLLAGLDKHFAFSTMAEIPKLWGDFVPFLGSVSGQVGNVAYGLSYDMNDSGFRYMAAVEIEQIGPLPEGFVTKSLPALRYAVFQHEEHLSKLCITIDSIWHQWLPSSGEVVTDPSIMFERYGPGFCPDAGKGDLEIWLAINS